MNKAIAFYNCFSSFSRFINETPASHSLSDLRFTNVFHDKDERIDKFSAE